MNHDKATHPMPTPEEMDELFEALEQRSPRLRHLLATRLYIRAEAWHDARNARGETLLLAAARNSQGGIFDMLLAKGFDPQAWDRQLKTALHLTGDPLIAVSAMRAGGIALALEADARGDLPLHLALRQGNAGMIATLLNSANGAAQVLRRNAAAEHPLFDAARHHGQAAVPMLLMGADPRWKNRDGATAVDVCGDPVTGARLHAFAAYLERNGALDRQDALALNERQRAATLAKQARQFLGNPGHPATQPALHPLQTPRAPCPADHGEASRYSPA